MHPPGFRMAVCLLLLLLAIAQAIPHNGTLERPPEVTEEQTVGLNTTVQRVIDAIGSSDRSGIVARKGVNNSLIAVPTSTRAPPAPVANDAPVAPVHAKPSGALNATIAPPKAGDVARAGVNATTSNHDGAIDPHPANHPAAKLNASTTATVTSSASGNATAVFVQRPDTAPHPPANVTAPANATISSHRPATNATAPKVTPSPAPAAVLPEANRTTTAKPATPSSTPRTTTTAKPTKPAKPPMKPKVTYSLDDEPKLLQAARPGHGTSGGQTGDNANDRLYVEEPLAQLSKEYIPSSGMLGGPPRNHREYVMPVVTLIFAVPLLLGLFLLSYRRAKEFWLTRHYRRMDFLIDGMYNY